MVREGSYSKIAVNGPLCQSIYASCFVARKLPSIGLEVSPLGKSADQPNGVEANRPSNLKEFNDI